MRSCSPRTERSTSLPVEAHAVFAGTPRMSDQIPPTHVAPATPGVGLRVEWGQASSHVFASDKELLLPISRSSKIAVCISRSPQR